MSHTVRVRVPASSANLGPGFDCLAIALDLWSEVDFTLAPQGVHLTYCGEGKELIPLDETNLVTRAALAVFERLGQPMPGLRIACRNAIPIGGGLGSSAAAILSGLLGANALLENPLTTRHILDMAAEMEGHPDNVAASLYGGLVVVISTESSIQPVRFDMPPLSVALVLPEVFLPTKVARAVLPKQVPMCDAVFNMGRAALVVQALQKGDLDLLAEVMDDRLHQPYRLKLIAGAEQAIQAARRAGAVAVALSGAGPSLIAFPRSGDSAALAQAMQQSFAQSNIQSRAWSLSVSPAGASAQILEQIPVAARTTSQSFP